MWFACWSKNEGQCFEGLKQSQSKVDRESFPGFSVYEKDTSGHSPYKSLPKGIAHIAIWAKRGNSIKKLTPSLKYILNTIVRFSPLMCSSISCLKTQTLNCSMELKILQ